MKELLKNAVSAVFLCAAFPLAALSGFGRIRGMYLLGAHLAALGPGLPGDYFRTAYYRLTLASCSPRCRISFGAIFSNADSTVADGVYIGPYSIMGRVRIGEHVQIASLVQVLSGAKQHGRDEQGNLMTGEAGVFEPVTIGANSWIGASAIVMADVGSKSTVGAGAVVTRPVPDGVVTVGNPARILNAAKET